MSMKGGNLFEQHIEKAVLAVVGLVCIWLLITRVAFSPNKVAYDGKRFRTSKIDPYIRKQAEVLQSRLNGRTESEDPYDAQLDKFIAKMGSAIGDIDVDVVWPVPGFGPADFGDNRKYRLPQIGSLGQAMAEHFRAVAYVPTVEIDKDNIYDKENSEPNDIDFVTVESTIAVGQLAESFYACFAGADVPEDWRDPCLAKPVFGAAQLQRRELLADEVWSDWQTVPRSRIDPHKKMFEIVEDVQKLPAGGVQVRLLNFDHKQILIDLLQPEAYRIASADEEWFPPSVHKKYVKYQKEQEAQEKREALEAERKKREEEREKLRPGWPGMRGETLSDPERISSSSRYSRGTWPRRIRGDRERGPGGRRDVAGMERETEGEERALRRIRGVPSKEGPGEKGKGVLETTTMKDFYDEYAKILITAKTDILKADEPLVFWAHDDTVEPGKSYQYRIRLGVFNPIAGTDQVGEEDKHLNNQVVLWSNFSDETKTLEIPARFYFFPESLQEVAKTVKVKVCRYVLGYWYSDDFRVSQGEVIGSVRAVELETAEGAEQGTPMSGVMIPETIDYSTAAMYVDAVRVNNWAGGRYLHNRPYYDMLYTFDGSGIEHIPISRSCWAAELQMRFNEIQELEERPKKPLRDWGSKTADYRRRSPKGADDEEYDDEEERERRAAARMRRE